MYNGDNKTALISQRMIAESMLKMLETKYFTDISISDLCREAQVSRQTFYSLFGTKENVIAYTLRNNCCYDPEKENVACCENDFRCICRSYSEYIIKNRHILELLVKNDMMHCLYDVQYSSFMACDHFIREIPEDDRVYLVDFIASGMNSIAKNYASEGCIRDRIFLEELMYRLFVGIYTYNSHSAKA